jgi:DNA-binding transcriptional ArsR family regulator
MKRNLEHIEYTEDTEALAKFAKVLGHPTRIAILKHLEKQSCCFTGYVNGEYFELVAYASQIISFYKKLNWLRRKRICSRL